MLAMITRWTAANPDLKVAGLVQLFRTTFMSQFVTDRAQSKRMFYLTIHLVGCLSVVSKGRGFVT